MRLTNFSALNAADATTTSQTSTPFYTYNWAQTSCVAVAVGGTITGTLKYQVCNDPLYNTIGNPPPSGANWVDCSQSVMVSAAGVFLIPTFITSYGWMKIVYTKASSAAGALITANVAGLGV